MVLSSSALLAVLEHPDTAGLNVAVSRPRSV